MRLKRANQAALAACVGTVFLGVLGGCQAPRSTVWVDVARGEPVTFNTLVDDLAAVDIVYLGERHSVDRHHAIQAQIIDALGDKGLPLVIAFEQVETFNQTWLDRYAEGELSFDELAIGMNWGERWRNYYDYEPLLTAGRRHAASFLALNARNETIREIGRHSLSALSAEQRAELPNDMNLDDPTYATHLQIIMAGAAGAMHGDLSRLVEAQIARDEMMANRLAEFLSLPEHAETQAIVICGSGHVNYGLGTAQRVRRRLPDRSDRIVILSNSGEVKLSAAVQEALKKAGPRPQPRVQTTTRIGDYLHVVTLSDGGAVNY